MQPRAWIALAAATALTACYPALSRVAAIPANAPPMELELTPGLYCMVVFAVMHETDDAGRPTERLKDLRYDPCFALDVEDGVVRIAGPGGEARSFRLAGLSRGALVAEVVNDAGLYELYFVKALDDAFAVMRPPQATPAIIDAASRHGVTLLDPALREGEPLYITDGAPEDVLAFLHGASGLWFDYALRDSAIFTQLYNRSTVVVRFDADPRETPPDEMRVRARIDRVRTAIRFAMTLE